MKLITFRKNPNVSRTEFTRSIASGGILVDVRGIGFRSLQKSFIVMFDDNRVLKGGQCRVIRDDLMQCLTPALNISRNRQ